ncbi:Appr-1-p processing [Artemisia annua]|uniref:Appr-1-p processing n=1 Tax=Artemisia annua TaxID=35608 RepID=A0A2U1KV38_ARTAN|nr:Appr-1-p processing [Artemisia annua]
MFNQSIIISLTIRWKLFNFEFKITAQAFSLRVVLELSEAIKIKDGEAESYISEIEVYKKAVYVDRLLQVFRYVPCEQLTIPDFVFQLSLLDLSLPMY